MAEALTGYHEKFEEMAADLIKHGWGELTFRATSLKDNTVKVEILCGKSFVFFIKKEVRFDKDLL